VASSFFLRVGVARAHGASSLAIKARRKITATDWLKMLVELLRIVRKGRSFCSLASLYKGASTPDAKHVADRKASEISPIAHVVNLPMT